MLARVFVRLEQASRGIVPCFGDLVDLSRSHALNYHPLLTFEFAIFVCLPHPQIGQDKRKRRRRTYKRKDPGYTLYIIHTVHRWALVGHV